MALLSFGFPGSRYYGLCFRFAISYLDLHLQLKLPFKSMNLQVDSELVQVSHIRITVCGLEEKRH